MVRADKNHSILYIILNSLLNALMLFMGLFALVQNKLIFGLLLGGFSFLNFFTLLSSPAATKVSLAKLLVLTGIVSNFLLILIGAAMFTKGGTGHAHDIGASWFAATGVLGMFNAYGFWRKSCDFAAEEIAVSAMQAEPALSSQANTTQSLEDAPATKPRAEIYFDRRKIFNLCLLAIVISLAAVFAVIAFFFPKMGPGKPEMPFVKYGFIASFTLFLMAIMYLIDMIKRRLRGAHIKIYETGIDIKNFGFRTWDRIAPYGAKSKLFFLVKQEPVPPTGIGPKIGAATINYSPKSRIVLLGYEFPAYLTNISVDEFIRANGRIMPAPPPEQREISLDDLAPAQKTVIVRTKKVNPVLSGLMTVFTLLALYGMAMHNFFPSDEGMKYRLGFSLILPALIAVSLISGVINKEFKIREGASKLKAYTILAMTVPLMWGIGYISFLGTGNLVTDIFGVEEARSIEVSKTTHTSNNRICVESNQINMPFTSEICLPREMSDKMPNTFMLTMVGKKSQFGFVNKRYRPIDTNSMEVPGNVTAYGKSELIVGLEYYSGKHGLTKDYAQAAIHLQNAVDEGSTEAMVILGGIYLEGKGVIKDVAHGRELLMRAAEKGNKDAQRELARIYHYGVGTAVDVEQEKKWLQMAAEQGDAPSQLALSLNLMKGTPEEKEQAMGWLKKSVAQNYAGAQAFLGMIYLDASRKNPKEIEEALKWLHLAADQDDATAQEALGFVYLQGRGVIANREAAGQLFLKAAQKGRKNAQLLAGVMSISGEGLPKNPAEGIKWLEKSAAQGNLDAQYELGMAQFFGKGMPKDEVKAIESIRKPAEHGNTKSQFFMGMMYSEGRIIKQDYSEALRWWRMAAEKENSDAQNAIGNAYEKGQGVPVDYVQALNWYTKSADQGNPVAFNGIGDIHYHGEGVPKDFAEAEIWYRRSATRGISEAQYDLARLYMNGEGVAQDYGEAYFWYSLAANGGFKEAPQMRDSAKSHLAGEQLSQLDNRVHDWKPKR